MTILNYLIWNGSPILFKVGPVLLRWYGLLFATGFLISQQLLYYIFKKEGKPEKDVDMLTLFMVVSTIIGARLGHVLFYEPDRFISNPIDVLKVWEGGLASHGAAIAILLGLWIYSRKRKAGQSYLQILDRIVILVALTSALIRIGNFFNGEIIGKPTDKPWGVVFANRLTDAISSKEVDSNNIVDYITYTKKASLEGIKAGDQSVCIYIFFKPNVNTPEIDYLINNNIRGIIDNSFYEFFNTSQNNFSYQLTKQSDHTYTARITTVGIARHPTQLYESFSFIFLFAILFWLWLRYKENLPTGRLFGIFLVICFSLRFAFEFLKENQVKFEYDLPLNMGQILSIPLIITGILVLIFSFRKKQPATAHHDSI